MIVTFTDFGIAGPYLGQMKSVLHVNAPGNDVVDLLADAPVCNPRASAYLLAAYSAVFPEGTVFLCVVDPGVGGDRRAIVVEIDGSWYVGPDNGLFEIIARRAYESISCWEILWRPDHMSNSFHGRDLFAPMAARLANGETPPGPSGEFQALAGNDWRLSDWPDDLAEIVYVDHFGNLVTGLRAEALATNRTLSIEGVPLPIGKTFTSMATGDMFCYENSNGLLEIAVNNGRADARCGMAIGGKVAIVDL